MQLASCGSERFALASVKRFGTHAVVECTLGTDPRATKRRCFKIIDHIRLTIIRCTGCYGGRGGFVSSGLPACLRYSYEGLRRDVRFLKFLQLYSLIQMHFLRSVAGITLRCRRRMYDIGGELQMNSRPVT